MRTAYSDSQWSKCASSLKKLLSPTFSWHKNVSCYFHGKIWRKIVSSRIRDCNLWSLVAGSLIPWRRPWQLFKRLLASPRDTVLWWILIPGLFTATPAILSVLTFAILMVLLSSIWKPPTFRKVVGCRIGGSKAKWVCTSNPLMLATRFQLEGQSDMWRRMAISLVQIIQWINMVYFVFCKI